MIERSRKHLWSATALVMAALIPMREATASASGADGLVSAQNVKETALWDLLLPPKTLGEPRLAQISTRIVGLGVDAVGPAVAILFGDIEEPASPHEVHPLAIDRRQQILMDALVQLPPRATVSAVRSRLDANADSDRAIFGVRLLGLAGGDEALDMIATIAGTLDVMQWHRPFVVNVFEESLARIAKQDTRNVRKLAAALMRAEPRYAAVFARALGSTDVPAAVAPLLRSVGRDRELDLCLMSELARIGDRGDLAGSVGDVSRLRGYCKDMDPGIQRAAAAALARMGDADACGALIAMLDSRNALTINIAERSLNLLSGTALGRDAKAWSAWRERETRWFDTEYQRILEALDSSDVKVVSNAIQSLVSHRMYKHEAAIAIRPMLNSSDPELQRMACTALGIVGSARALPWLLEKLGSLEEPVRDEALASLRKLTGLPLPLDIESWRVAISGS
ncbi:MAG: HEAT repeat domain-containing protein [Planctomycetes bacterium]|nr:HEAT repeat domain-containing protein [Planctomycetota bacterium]